MRTHSPYRRAPARARAPFSNCLPSHHNACRAKLKPAGGCGFAIESLKVCKSNFCHRGKIQDADSARASGRAVACIGRYPGTAQGQLAVARTNPDDHNGWNPEIHSRCAEGRHCGHFSSSFRPPDALATSRLSRRRRPTEFRNGPRRRGARRSGAPAPAPNPSRPQPRCAPRAGRTARKRGCSGYPVCPGRGRGP